MKHCANICDSARLNEHTLASQSRCRSSQAVILLAMVRGQKLGSIAASKNGALTGNYAIPRRFNSPTTPCTIRAIFSESRDSPAGHPPTGSSTKPSAASKH